MSDLIERALDGWQDEEEREVSGTVDGHDIRLVKKEYKAKQRGPTHWKVAVYVKDDGPTATEKVKELTASEAQEMFEELVEKHNL